MRIWPWSRFYYMEERSRRLLGMWMEDIARVEKKLREQQEHCAKNHVSKTADTRPDS